MILSKKFMLKFLLCFGLILTSTSYGEEKKFDVVFDLDWTVFYKVQRGAPFSKDDQVLLISGEAYRATDDIGKVIFLLQQRHPNVRISFFSGGSRSRNEILLRSISLPNKRSAFEAAFRVYSEEDLERVSEDNSLPFAQRFKKPIQRLLPQFDAERTILIDDHPEFAQGNLRAVNSLGKLNFSTQFLTDKVGTQYYPASEEIWTLERAKAWLWYNAIDQAISEATSTGQSFSQLVVEKWPESLEDRVRPTTKQLRLFQLQRREPPMGSCHQWLNLSN